MATVIEGDFEWDATKARAGGVHAVRRAIELAALVLPSVVLTALRVLTGSTVVSAAAHLTHNVLLALIATR